MNIQTTKKIRATCKAALLGAAIIGGIYLFIVFGTQVLGWHSSEGPDLSLLFAGVLPELVRNVTGIGKNPASTFSVFLFDGVVDTVFGAVVFFLCAAFWQFCLKGENET